MNDWLRSLESIVHPLLPYAPGSTVFWGALAADALALAVFGWLINTYLFDSKKPAWLICGVNLLGLAAGLAASAAMLAFGSAGFQPPALAWTVVAGAGICAYALTAALVARPVLDHKLGPALGVMLLSLACAWGAAWMVNVLIRSVGGSLQGLEQRQEQRLPQ